MSAVVQELYAGLPVALSAELTALSDPKIVLDAQPETSTFVLSCGRDLPTEHRRNYGLKICSKNSGERLDCTGQLSCPGPMELIPEEPTDAGDLAEDKRLLKEVSLCRNLREDGKAAIDVRDAAEKGLLQRSLTPQENCCTKWKEPQLTQEERGLFSRPSYAEIAGFLQNLEEKPVNMQVTTESLPYSIKEAQGMKADGTRLFRESSTRVGPGVPSESSECSNVDNVMAEVEVSETSTIFSHEPVHAMDNVSSEEHPQRKDKEQELTACTILSATTDVSSKAGGETSLGQQANAAHNNNLLSQQDKKDLHDNVFVPVSESLVVADDQLSYMSSEASGLHFKSCLEFGNVLWKDNINIFEVICEMQKESLLGKEEKSNTSFETLELLEEWAPNVTMNKTASPVWSSEVPSSDDEQEMGICTDHSYSSLFKESSEHQTSEEHLQGDLRPVLSEIDSTQKQAGQLRAFPNAGCMATEVEENRPFLVEPSNVACKQATLGSLQHNSIVHVSSVLINHDSLGGEESLSKLEPSNDEWKRILNSASATHLHATHTTCTVDTNLGIDEENHEIIPLSEESPFTQQADMTLSSTEFLGSLPRGGFPGLCAKLKPESIHCLLHHRRKSLSANWKCGGSTFTSVPAMPSDTGKGMTDIATTNNTEEVDRLRMSHASVRTKTVGPSERDVKRCDSPNQSSWVYLDRKDGSLDSASWVGVSFSTEAENQRADEGTDDSGGANAEEVLDVDISSPDTDLKQGLIKASLEVNDRMGMLGSVKGYENCLGNNMSEKTTSGRGLEETFHPFKFDSFRKGQSQEERQKYQAHPSSSSSFSNLKTDLDSGRSAFTKQQDRPALDKPPSQHQTRIHALVRQDYRFHSLDQKNITLQEARILAYQKLVLDISREQVERDTVQTVNHLLEDTQKSVVHTQDESLCPKRDGDINPQNHLVLLAKNGVQETFQASTKSNSSSYKKISNLIRNPLKGRLIELSNTGMVLEYFGRSSKLLKSNRFIPKRGCQRAAEFCSVLRSVRRRSLEVRTKKRFLKFSSKSALLSNHSSFLLNTITFRTAGGWRSMEGVCSKLFKDSLICISFGLRPTQNPEACLPEKDEPSTSLSLNVLDFSSAAAVLLKIKADNRIHPVFSEDGKAICSVKEVVPVAFPLGSTVPSKPGVEVAGKVLSIASGVPNPSKDSEQSFDNGHSLISAKMKIPVHSFSQDSSGAILDLLLVGKEEITVPFKSEICISPPFFHPVDCISELSLSEGHAHAKNPSQSAVVQQHVLQSEGVFPSVTLGTTCNTVPFTSLSGSMFEALARCFGKERILQSIEKQIRDQRKTLEYLADIGNEGQVNKRTSETGGSPIFMKKTVQEGMEEILTECTTFSEAVSQHLGAKHKGEAGNLFRQRSIRTGYLLVSSSNEVVAFSAGKHEDPALTLVVGSTGEDCENKRHCSTLRDSKRPKGSKDLIGLEYTEAKDSEARSPSLCFSSHRQQSTNIDIPVPVFCMLPQAFGIRRMFKNVHKIRQSRPPRRRSGNIRKNDYMQGHFKVKRKSNQIKSFAFLKKLLEIVPEYKCNISSVCLAMKPAAIENKAAMIWGQSPKQRTNRSSLVDIFGLSKSTKDLTVLKSLSALASKLLDPLTNLQKFKVPMSFTDLFPLAEKNNQLGRKKLMEVFSWVNLKLNSQELKGSCYSTKMFSSQSLALYPIESTNTSVLESRNNTPLAFRTPAFPLPFYIQMSSSPMRSIQESTSLHSIANKVALGELEALHPAKWTFSFLLSQSNLGESLACEGIPAESCIASATFHAAKDNRKYTVAKRSSGCSMLGLQTVLALSSPGCYRLWTRKRNLTSQIPAIQRLTVLQFAQGLKGLKCSSSISADLFSSLPYLLGRVLSIWSQHGPPTCPSEFTPLHSNRCKWQPVTTATTSLGLGNSSAMLPHVPDQVVEAPRIVYNELRLEPCFPASLSASCLIPEPEHSPLGFLTPEFQVYPLDDVSVPVLPATGTQLEKAKLEKRPKKVSQIRIRKTIPKPDPNLTPMGLPRPKRLKKTEFSLEEIYTNKNYKSPPATRCLETIFEEPKEKNGSLISVSQQKRKRILEFQDFTIPRKRRARGRIKVMGSFTRAQKAALEGKELDSLLIQKLTDLETFFAMEEEREQGHAPGS